VEKEPRNPWSSRWPQPNRPPSASLSRGCRPQGELAPRGHRPLAQGCPATGGATLGGMGHHPPTPSGLRQSAGVSDVARACVGRTTCRGSAGHDATPWGLVIVVRSSPRVAACSPQPWAMGFNPDGIVGPGQGHAVQQEEWPQNHPRTRWPQPNRSSADDCRVRRSAVDSSMLQPSVRENLARKTGNGVIVIRSEDSRDKASPAQRPELPGAARRLPVLLFFVLLSPRILLFEQETQCNARISSLLGMLSESRLQAEASAKLEQARDTSDARGRWRRSPSGAEAPERTAA